VAAVRNRIRIFEDSPNVPPQILPKQKMKGLSRFDGTETIRKKREKTLCMVG